MQSVVFLMVFHRGFCADFVCEQALRLSIQDCLAAKLDNYISCSGMHFQQERTSVVCTKKIKGLLVRVASPAKVLVCYGHTQLGGARGGGMA